MSALNNTMRLSAIILLIVALGCTTLKKPASVSQTAQRKPFRMMFYNVENLFDTIDSPHHNDNEFLPESDKRWNSYKYYHKLKSIYKTVVAVGEWELPAVMCFAEVENKAVLLDLIYKTPLYKSSIGVVHHESRDKRGIDVAMIFNKNEFDTISSEPIRVNLGDNRRTTRDILYVKGIARKKDTLHIYVNHWPSRYGGQVKSEPKRRKAALTLKMHVDSILSINKNSQVVILGDFNDEPNDFSINNVLKAGEYDDSNDLINLSYGYCSSTMGTNKYKNNWSCLDQIIVSKSLKNKVDTCNSFKADFLLIEEKSGIGVKLFRTYAGPRYLGGFSDHLPVYIDLSI